MAKTEVWFRERREEGEDRTRVARFRCWHAPHGDLGRGRVFPS